MNRSPNALRRLTALGAAGALLLTACGGNGGGNQAENQPQQKNTGPVTLKVNFWGDFGLDQLAREYEAANPNVKIRLNAGDYNQQHQDLQKFLVAGSGAPDIAAIDEGFIVQFRNQSDKFVNLLEKGADKYQDKYLGWKWKQSLSADGKTQIGLGTDVGGLAMCYRRDLFKAAGLPTERDKVSALWPDWDAFINVGKQYVQNSGGKKFVDAGTNIMNPVLAQQPVGYFTEEDELAMDGGPKVAWDTANKVIEAKLSAGLAAFTPEWNNAFKTGTFAVLACPAWMMGYIQGQAPGTKGKWDVAAIPGGGGNWGGSFLTVPKQGKNVDEAYKFIEYIVAAENQIKVFKKVGNLPAQPALYDDPAIQAFKNEFFNNAPVGQIFSTTARELTPQYLGKKSGPVRVAVENVLRKVEQGKTDATAGWEEARKEAEKAAR